jgi:hypothetical protein
MSELDRLSPVTRLKAIVIAVGGTTACAAIVTGAVVKSGAALAYGVPLDRSDWALTGIMAAVAVVVIGLALRGALRSTSAAPGQARWLAILASAGIPIGALAGVVFAATTLSSAYPERRGALVARCHEAHGSLAGDALEACIVAAHDCRDATAARGFTTDPTPPDIACIRSRIAR